jgi:iron-sulfur cluster repair protein YtfE (RIC family)
MKATVLTDLMVKDHGKIVKMLHDVEKSIGMELISTMKVFDNFEWELEKHMFVEEKAIFTSYNPKNIASGYRMMPTLVQQHNDLLNKLQVMRKDLTWQRPAKFEEFRELLLTHKTFEETSLYPKLDQELSVQQKEEIIKKIREILP